MEGMSDETTIDTSVSATTNYETEKELLYIANILSLKSLFEFAQLAMHMPDRFGPVFQPSVNQLDLRIVKFCGLIGKLYETLHVAYELDPSTPVVSAYINTLIDLAQINCGNSVTKPEQLNRLNQIACKMINEQPVNWDTIVNVPGHERWIELLERFHITLTVIFLSSEISRVNNISIAHVNQHAHMASAPKADRDFLIRSLAKLQRFFEIFHHLSTVTDKQEKSAGTEAPKLPPVKLYDPVTLLTIVDTLDDATFEHISDFSQRIAPIVMATVNSGNGNSYGGNGESGSNPLAGFSSFLSNSPVVGLVGTMFSKGSSIDKGF